MDTPKFVFDKNQKLTAIRTEDQKEITVETVDSYVPIVEVWIPKWDVKNPSRKNQFPDDHIPIPKDFIEMLVVTAHTLRNADPRVPHHILTDSERYTEQQWKLMKEFCATLEIDIIDIRNEKFKAKFDELESDSFDDIKRTKSSEEPPQRVIDEMRSTTKQYIERGYGLRDRFGYEIDYIKMLAMLAGPQLLVGQDTMTIKDVDYVFYQPPIKSGYIAHCGVSNGPNMLQDYQESFTTVTQEQTLWNAHMLNRTYSAGRYEVANPIRHVPMNVARKDTSIMIDEITNAIKTIRAIQEEKPRYCSLNSELYAFDECVVPNSSSRSWSEDKTINTFSSVQGAIDRLDSDSDECRKPIPATEVCRYLKQNEMYDDYLYGAISELNIMGCTNDDVKLVRAHMNDDIHYCWYNKPCDPHQKGLIKPSNVSCKAQKDIKHTLQQEKDRVLTTTSASRLSMCQAEIEKPLQETSQSANLK